MHEWLITRGHVQSAPFEWRMQIYVPWNCVLVHEGKCHKEAQWTGEGRLKCFENVAKFYQAGTIREWLCKLEPYLEIAEEKLRWFDVWCGNVRFSVWSYGVCDS